MIKKPLQEEDLLMRLFAQGDEQAFRQVFEMLLHPLCYFAEKLILQRQEAEDAVSLAFYKLWDRHRDFTSIAGIRSFLYTTVRNQCLDLLRHQAVVRSAREKVADPPSVASIETSMYQAELLQLIHQEIQGLPRKSGQILEWSFLEELSTAEIAQKLLMTETHVRVEKSRALVQLRAALRKKQLWDQALVLFLLLQTGK